MVVVVVVVVVAVAAVVIVVVATDVADVTGADVIVGVTARCTRGVCCYCKCCFCRCCCYCTSYLLVILTVVNGFFGVFLAADVDNVPLT